MILQCYPNVSAILRRHTNLNLVSCAFSTIPIFPPFNSQNFLIIRRTRRICENYFHNYHTQIISDYVKILIGITFNGDLHPYVSRFKLKLKVKIGISLSMVE